MIPELITPTYLEMRDRVTVDGRHWVGEDMRQFLSQKLADNNDLLTARAKRYSRIKNCSNNAFYSLKKRIYSLIHRW